MALTKEQKQVQVKELTEKMSAASSLILANYIGLNVAEVSELRGQLKQSDAEMKVAKKTLMKIAAKEAGIENFADADFTGPVSIIFSFGDPLSGAQTAFKFSKNHKQVEIIGGMFDGKILSKEQALELAQMPSRDVLLTIFVCMIRSPLVSFAGMCNSPLTGFARALSELSKKGGIANPEAAAPVASAPMTEEAPPTTADESASSTEVAETEPSDSEKSES